MNKMNRREFLKKGLVGVVLGSIPLISNCGKNPVNSNTGSISGKVSGIDQTVKVRAIQNLKATQKYRPPFYWGQWDYDRPLQNQ